MKRFLFPVGALLLAALYACSPGAGSGASSSSEDSASDNDAISEDGAGQTALCDAAGITAYDYMMAFHACPSDCGNPANHDVYLAGSDDGIDWTLVDTFESFEGSVPELVYADEKLFLHTPNEVRSYNACFQALSSDEVEFTSAEDSGGYVDPSLIVEDGEVHLFYLPGILGQDPAGCATYPCTKEIHSAIAGNAAQTAFTQVASDRAEIALSSGTASDPEIVTKADDSYLLYVSSGQSVLVFIGTSLTGTFVSPDGDETRAISDGAGGVPSAITAPGGEVWLYVTTNDAGVEVIRRATSTDGVTQISDGAFSTVVDATINPDFSATMSVSSPSVIAWPDAGWTQGNAE